MLTSLALTIGIIFSVMLAGIGVELLYRHFQSRHPQLGPFRKLDGSCSCHCNVCDKGGC